MKYFNRKGQGATEYLVIVGILLLIIIAAFNTSLSSAIMSKVSSIASQISGGGNG